MGDWRPARTAPASNAGEGGAALDGPPTGTRVAPRVALVYCTVLTLAARDLLAEHTRVNIVGEGISKMFGTAGSGVQDLPP